jgi:hypothetical protein
MLGYYIDIFDKQLENFMIRSSEEKTENTRVNFENAISKGVFNYKWERVLELNAEQPRISVVHVINAMQKDRYSIPGMELWDIYRLYFWPGSKEFIETETISGYDAVDIIKKAGGIPIIAHPKTISNDDTVLDMLRYGAEGLEVFHPIHAIEEMKKYVAEKYPNVKIVTVETGEDDMQKSIEAATNMLTAYPNLKGIICNSSVAVPGAGQAVLTKGKQGKVMVSGLSTPNQCKDLVGKNAIQSLQLWDTGEMGALAVQAMADLLSGKKIQEGYKFENFPNATVTGTTIMQNNNLDFTKDNIDKYNF